jgi:hypothetical protein
LNAAVRYRVHATDSGTRNEERVLLF